MKFPSALPPLSLIFPIRKKIARARRSRLLAAAAATLPLGCFDPARCGPPMRGCGQSPAAAASAAAAAACSARSLVI
eukprot:363278-Chlamydomonas_euryale.AAC.8